jgi:outer membrane immunogenic protein
MPRKAPPAEPAYNWTGFYLGVEGGGAVGRSNQIAGGPLGFGSLTSTYDISGGIVGGTVGHNVQSGPWVYGLEGDGSWTDITGGGHEVAPFTKSTIDTTTMHWLATGRGRLGWAYKDTMLYATGGVAAAGVEAGIQTVKFGNFTDDQTRWGYAVGGGIEAKIAQGWTLKGEYLYVDFSSQGYFNPAPTAAINIRSDVPVYSHILRLGLNYHFLLQ